MKTPLSRRHFLGASAATAGLVASAPSLLAAAPNDQSSAMPRRPLGKTGWLVSIVGFGGGSQFLSQQNMETVERMLERAVELGVNYFDTAYTYLTKGERESLRRYGKYLVPKHRPQIFLTSKITQRAGDAAAREFEQTLKDLGTDHLDLLHFHAVNAKTDVDKIVAENGALKVYRKLKEQGAIRAIGITGHSSGAVLLDAIERIDPDCVMCPQNPAHSGANSGGDFAQVIPVALRRGMGMIAMKTTARNGLIGKNGVKAEELVRYALNLPVAAAVIGMPSVEVLESCAAIARSLQPMADPDRKALEQRLAMARPGADLPYLAHGYCDGAGDRLA